MDYDQFIAELDGCTKGQILAHDDHDSTCILYLRDGKTTIAIDEVSVRTQRSSAIVSLQTGIRLGHWPSRQMVLLSDRGGLVLECQESVCEIKH